MLSFLNRLPFLRKKLQCRQASTPRRASALRLEPLEERTVPADIAMLSAHLDAPTVVGFDYQITAGTGPFQVAVFRSADAVFDSSDVLVGAPQTVTPAASTSVQTGQIALAAKLPIDPVRHFVLVVADPGGSVPESDETNNTASFRKLALGVIAHGLSLFETRAAWVDDLGNLLEAKGYAATVRLDWVVRSRIPAPNLAILTGVELAQTVRAQAAALATQSNDVVDVHFIGHSRGTAVISVALLALQIDPGPPALALGFHKETLLDPHVARNHGTLAAGRAELAARTGFSSVGLFSYNPGSTLARNIAAAVLSFQATARDPVPFIPANVDTAEVFFQQLVWNRTITLDRVGGINLWAEPRSAIANPFLRPALFINIGALGIGHTGVPELYERLVALT
jgi:hypothetical protein